MKGNTPYLVVNGLMKHYGNGEARVQVLDGITTTINKGEICVMLGPSGSGKSTFLNLIGGLEGADGGTIRVGECEITSLSEKPWANTAAVNLASFSSSTTWFPTSPFVKISRSQHTFPRTPFP